jgi:TetR/AcrR family transcriptional regulator
MRNEMPSRLGSRHQPEQTRAAILDAAAKQFAEHGIAGARTDEIARSAGVNKALLYYYFADKETLYTAVMNQQMERLAAVLWPMLDSDLSPRDKILGYVGTHFDFIASHPMYPRLMQRHMMSAAHGRAEYLREVVSKFFRPTYERVGKIICAGIASGDFRPVDPRHFVPSMIAVIVFYFGAAPVMKLMHGGGDPLSPERVAERRAAVLDFISAALFRPDAEPKRPKKNALRKGAGK